MKFIYVFSLNDKEKLQNAGFTLLKEDAKNSIYIFANSEKMVFELDNVGHVLSNVLTF